MCDVPASKARTRTAGEPTGDTLDDGEADSCCHSRRDLRLSDADQIIQTDSITGLPGRGQLHLHAGQFRARVPGIAGCQAAMGDRRQAQAAVVLRLGKCHVRTARGKAVSQMGSEPDFDDVSVGTDGLQHEIGI